MVHRLAPSVSAASSSAGSSTIRTGSTARTTKGSVMNPRHRRMEGSGEGNFHTPLQEPASHHGLGPEEYHSMIPATRVGIANGRSITAERSDRPGNRKRTSTQAVAVPIKAFPTAMTSAVQSERTRRSSPRGTHGFPERPGPALQPLVG